MRSRRIRRAIPIHESVAPVPATTLHEVRSSRHAPARRGNPFSSEWARDLQWTRVEGKEER